MRGPDRHFEKRGAERAFPVPDSDADNVIMIYVQFWGKLTHLCYLSM